MYGTKFVIFDYRRVYVSINNPPIFKQHFL